MNNTIIEVIREDITKIEVDAIVNAANTSLLGGSGVDGAIHRAGGTSILEECRKIKNKQGGCRIGKAVITTAGQLHAKFVIHAVGPVWNDGNKNEDYFLMSAYENSLKLCVKNDIKTVAFPNISTGIYKFPKERAANIAIKTVLNFNQINMISKVIFVCFDVDNFNIYKDLIEREKPPA
jgi:O-acetyl-ADP-ribose deacetylase (regulator of RNase III)